MKSPLAFAFAATLLVGCTPSPESLCKKFDDLRAASDKDKDEDKDKDKDKAAKRAKDDHDDCVGELGAAKEASSDGYKAIAKCTEKTGWKEAMGCIGDAVDKDAKVKDAFEAWSKKKEEARKKKMVDKINAWPDGKTKTTEGKIKGYSGDKVTSFTIDLGDTFSQNKDMKSETMAMYEMKMDDDDFLLGPSITIENGIGAPDLDQAVKFAEDAKHKVLKKDKTDKGYIIEEESDTSLTVKSVVANGDASIECEARIFSDETRAAKDKLLPWLEKMCKSLTVK